MDGTEYTPVQVGEVLRRPREEILAARAAARTAAAARTEPGGHTNVREGDATVDVQTDRIEGPLIIHPH